MHVCVGKYRGCLFKKKKINQKRTGMMENLLGPLLFFASQWYINNSHVVLFGDSAIK